MTQINFTLKALQNMPTLAQGQADDLKISTPTLRVWLSRLTVEDGMPYNNQVTIEKYQIDTTEKTHGSLHARWITVSEYEAK